MPISRWIAQGLQPVLVYGWEGNMRLWEILRLLTKLSLQHQCRWKGDANSPITLLPCHTNICLNFGLFESLHKTFFSADDILYYYGTVVSESAGLYQNGDCISKRQPVWTALRAVSLPAAAEATRQCYGKQDAHDRSLWRAPSGGHIRSRNAERRKDARRKSRVAAAAHISVLHHWWHDHQWRSCSAHAGAERRRTMLEVHHVRQFIPDLFNYLTPKSTRFIVLIRNRNVTNSLKQCNITAI